MRISKMIVALLVSVVTLTALTGVAVAGPENVYVETDSKDIPYCPNSVSYEVDVYDILVLGEEHDIKAVIYTAPDTEGDLDDLQFKFTDLDKGTNSGWMESDQVWTWGSESTTYYNDDGELRGRENFTLEVCAKAEALKNTKYRFRVVDNSDYEDGSGTTTGETIPEFATIAIPAIAVLGLFLFFNKRKHKKD